MLKFDVLAIVVPKKCKNQRENCSCYFFNIFNNDDNLSDFPVSSYDSLIFNSR